MTDAVREYREAKLDPELDAGDIMGYADAAIAELQDKLDRAQEYARIEVKRKNEAVERECAAIERAEKAEAEAARLRCCGNCKHLADTGEDTNCHHSAVASASPFYRPPIVVECFDHCHFAPSRWQRREG